MKQKTTTKKKSMRQGARKPQINKYQNIDSNGPDGKIRGNINHVIEKYIEYAREAISQGDRVKAENFYQHADHYCRLALDLAVEDPGSVEQPSVHRNTGHRSKPKKQPARRKDPKDFKFKKNTPEGLTGNNTLVDKPLNKPIEGEMKLNQEVS